jgi:hypothetical protein
MMGVDMVLEALMISLSRGTPSVTFMLETPAKWNVCYGAKQWEMISILFNHDKGMYTQY